MMLISRDLLKFLSTDLAPAQLCLYRTIGSDNEFVLRVRYRDVHLDYPLVVPLFSSAEEVTKKCNFDEVRKALVVMSKMVVPPGTEIDHNWCPSPEPAILAPQAPGKFFYEW